MATSAGYSGAISLNTIHIEVGEGSSGTTCSIGDADIRNRMGYGAIATSFYGFYKSWGTSITHGSVSVAGSKIQTAHTTYGFSKNSIVLSNTTGFGSVSDGTMHPSASGGGKFLWLDQMRYNSHQAYNYVAFHNSTVSTHTNVGIPDPVSVTDPFRATKIARICWNDAARALLSTPVSNESYRYWQDLVLPASGTYDFGLRWLDGS